MYKNSSDCIVQICTKGNGQLAKEIIIVSSVKLLQLTRELTSDWSNASPNLAVASMLVGGGGAPELFLKVGAPGGMYACLTLNVLSLVWLRFMNKGRSSITGNMQKII